MGNNKFEFITEMQGWFNIRKKCIIHYMSRIKGIISCWHKLGSPKADIETEFGLSNVY